MKVAFVFMHPFSESMGSVVRVRELALSLGKKGVEVYIFTPYERSFSLFPNVHVVSINEFLNTIGLSKPLYTLSKFLYYTKAFPRLFSQSEESSKRFVTKLIRGLAVLLMKNNIDLIQVEQDATLPIGIALKEETGLPLIADIHNISSEELVATGILKKKTEGFYVLQKATGSGLSKADHVFVVSEYMRDYVITNYGLNSANVSVAPPGGRPYVDKSVVAKRGKAGKVVYSGLVAYRERVDLFVKSMPFVMKEESEARFYITNKGKDLKNIKLLANKLGVNPEFFWYDTYEQVNIFLSSCHLGILPSSDDVARKMGTPAKLFNYLSAGLPVIANRIGGWSKIIHDEEVGLLTSDGPKDFAEAISNLLKDDNLRLKLSLRALDVVAEKYNWDKSAESLFTVYERFA